MEYCLFLVLPLLSTFKVIIQSYIIRTKTHTLADNIFLNFLIFVFAFISFGLINCVNVVNFFKEFDYRLLLFALGYGANAILFQTFYCLAFRNGPVGITSTIVSFSIVMQILFGLFAFNEKLNVLNYIAFIPLLLSLIFLKKPKNPNEDKHANVKWIIFAILALFFCGCTSILGKYFNSICTNSYNGVYITFGYLFASLFSLPLIFVFKKKDETLFKTNWKIILFLALCGLILATYNFLLTLGLTYFSLSILSPVISAIGTIFSILVDIIIYKEKPRPLQWVGVGLAICAIVLLTINVQF